MLEDKMSFSVLLTLIRSENPKFLDECLGSLYNQTLKPNEIVLVVEGELDEEHYKIIKKWEIAFSGILRIVKVPAKTGFPASLNIGLQSCNFEYVARMDTDDVCLSERFKKQMAFLAQNPEITIMGSYINEYSHDLKNFNGLRVVPTTHAKVIRFAKFRSPFNHQTVIYKKEPVLSLGGYPLFKSNEDYALFGILLKNGYKSANIPEPLVNARAGKGLIFRRKGAKYISGEIENAKFLYSIGFYSLPTYIINFVLKNIIRILPSGVIGIMYKLFLRKRTI